MSYLSIRPFMLCAGILAILAGTSRGDVGLIGIATVPGTTADLSELPGKQTDGTPHNQFGGISGIAYTGKGSEYVLLSDRGPKDGASDFVCRFHRIEIHVKPDTKPVISLKLTATTLLTDETGRRYTGDHGAFHPTDPEKSVRLDPEGICLGREGTVFTSDEYGPVIYEFDAKGKRLRSLPIPNSYRPAYFAKLPADEMPPKNKIGRLSNRGMEGLTISPDGTKVYGIMQSSLIQDGALDPEGMRVGVNCRLLEVELKTGKMREFVYKLESAANGISEILAVNDHEFLVLERDSKGGKEAEFKRIIRIDLSGATDVGGATELPKKALPVKKQVLIDLLDPKFKIAGAECPEKFEGLAFGPDLPNGQRLLLVTADNDFLAVQPILVYAFAIDRTELRGFQAQQFTAER